MCVHLANTLQYEGLLLFTERRSVLLNLHDTDQLQRSSNENSNESSRLLD